MRSSGYELKGRIARLCFSMTYVVVGVPISRIFRGILFLDLFPVFEVTLHVSFQSR